MFSKYFYNFLFINALWLMVWGTYNTYIARIFSPGFPHNTLDLIHGLRIFLPFIALILAIIIIIRRRKFLGKFLKTPLGFLGLYTIVGLISSLLLSVNHFEALYWGVLYGCPIFVLFAILVLPNPERKLSTIINLNLLIAGIIAILLLIYFLFYPGTISSITYNFLICNLRPFEDLGNIIKGEDMFGMAGTRPTGFARFAGVIAVTAFVGFLYAQPKTKEKKVWIFLFTLFFLILLFSKGRTAIIAFLISMVFILWLYKKMDIGLFLAVCLILAVSLTSVFIKIPCSNNFVDFSKKEGSITVKDNIFTLTGRTVGVWPESWKLFLYSPLIGYGFQADRYFLGGQHAHNTLFQSIIQTGLIGTMFLILAFVLTFIYLYRATNSSTSPKEKYFIVVLIGLFVFFAVRSITESSGAYFDADWLFLAPIIAYAQYLNSSKKNVLHGGQLSVTILGKKINIIKISEVLEKINYWVKEEKNKNHWIVLCGMHGVVEGHKDPDFKRIINSADLSLVDGMSLFFMAKLMGFKIKERVAGPDLMKEYLKFAEKKGYTTFFLGDTDEIIKKLIKKTSLDFPNLKIVGAYSPPFRKFTEEDNKEIIETINQKNPDVLWVAFSLKKQEKWIYYHRHKINTPVVIGVGAGFKFLSGSLKRAPKWVGDLGFEWLWRLVFEPKRIWKRVFIYGPLFFWLAFLDFMGLYNKK